MTPNPTIWNRKAYVERQAERETVERQRNESLSAAHDRDLTREGSIITWRVAA